MATSKIQRSQRILWDAINCEACSENILLFPPPLSIIKREAMLIRNGTVEGDNNLVTVLYEQYILERENFCRTFKRECRSFKQYYLLMGEAADIVDDVLSEEYNSENCTWLPYVVFSIHSWNNTFEWFLEVTEEKLINY